MTIHEEGFVNLGGAGDYWSISYCDFTQIDADVPGDVHHFSGSVMRHHTLLAAVQVRSEIDKDGCATSHCCGTHEVVDMAALLVAVQPTMTRVARTVRDAFRGYVDTEDLSQALTVWTMEHERIVRKYLDPPGDNEDGTTSASAIKDGRRKLHTTYRRIARGIAHQAKADTLGYGVGDVMFYSKATLSVLLPLMYGMDGGAFGAPGNGERRSPKDPALGNDLLAMICDVRGAFEASPEYDREILSLRFIDDLDTSTMANELGMTRSNVYKAIDRALYRVIERLGDVRPEFASKPGRKVRSNAESTVDVA